MNSIFVLVGKDFSLLFRSKMAVMITFMIPLALVYGISSIYGLTGHPAGPKNIPVAIVDEAHSAASIEFIRILKTVPVVKILTETSGSSARPLTATDLPAAMKDGTYKFGVVLPKNFLSDPFQLRARLILHSRDDVENQVVRSVLEATMNASVPSILIQNLKAAAPGTPERVTATRRLAYSLTDSYGGEPETTYQKLQAGDVEYLQQLTNVGALKKRGEDESHVHPGPFVTIDTEQSLGKDVKSPQATQLVGGWAIQFLLFAVSGSAAGLFAEKNLGIFQRLLAGRVSRSQLLWSKFLYGVCLGLVQLIILFSAGHFIIGFEIAPYFGMLTLVCLAAAAACSAFGMLIASVSRTIETATGLSTVLIMLMCAIGGVWFPPSFMPEFIQKIACTSLVYWTNLGFTEVLWAHASFVQLIPIVGSLATIVAIVMTFAVWRFNRGEIFR